MSAFPDEKPIPNVFKECRTIHEILDSQKDKFLFEQSHGISKENFLYTLRRFKPNILHFSGHGTERSALVFQDDETISTQQLEKTFKSLLPFKISVVFLNSCYSKVQARSISKFVNYVIGMRDSITDEAAILFSSAFYKSLSDNPDIEKAFQDATTLLNYTYTKESEIPKLIFTHGFSKSSQMNKQKEQHNLSVEKEDPDIIIQNKPIANDLLSQIEKTIKIYDEKIVVNDKIDLQNYWKNEKEGNLSKILLLLNNNSSEYGLDETQLEIIRNGIRFIPELIPKQHEKNNHKNILHLYDKITNLVLRKIFFNYKIDSIQKIQPLSPRNMDSNKTIEILSRLFSVHDFVYNLKNQIDESIKMVNDKLFLNHSIIQLLSTIQIMEIEFDQLVRLIELEPKIFHVPLSFTSLSDKLINLLKNNKYNKTNLVKARDIVVQIENKIDTSLKNNLFEKEGK
ncbi:MAG: hypothetical protein K0S93_838 [Nitrososphaeraceae archaeon]|jgi:hypothetical protein|nr:hypothetical protein [Nitrososphaeraceae archaeon]